MHNNHIIIAALALAVVTLVGLFAALGGCGAARPGGKEPAKIECVPPAPLPVAPANPDREIGPDAGLVGRLEKPATVTATLYKAEGGVTAGATVGLQPGTWLIPEKALQPPEAPAPMEAGHE